MRISDWSSDVCSSDLGILFGLADLGFGSPELGSFALAELESVRLPFGLGIERDILFEGNYPLSVYAAAAHRAGSLVLGEKQLSSAARRSEEHTSELQSLMRISYAVFCLKKTKYQQHNHKHYL